MSTANIDMNYGGVAALSSKVSGIAEDLGRTASEAAKTSVSSRGFATTAACNEFSATLARQIRQVATCVDQTGEKLAETAQSLAQMEADAQGAVNRYFGGETRALVE